MGKRLIKQTLNAFLAKGIAKKTKVDLLKTDGSVLHGFIKAEKGDEIIFVNDRLNKLKIAKASVKEIIYDEESAY